MPRMPVLCLSAAMLLGAGPAAAADAAAGAALAERWCTGCHVTETAAKGTDAAPTFRSVADRADLKDEEIEAWLSDPHPIMPDLKLTRAQIEDLTAYIRSLKSD